MNRSVLDPSGYVYVHDRMLYGIRAFNRSFVSLTDSLKAIFTTHNMDIGLSFHFLALI